MKIEVPFNNHVNLHALFTCFCLPVGARQLNSVSLSPTEQRK
jgi:hypothetical protein